MFIGVILTATSVSITVETLKEMGKLNSQVGITILGAAVIDDILGIIALTIITSLADPSVAVGIVLLKIVGFFAFAVGVGFVTYILFKKWSDRHIDDHRRFCGDGIRNLPADVFLRGGMVRRRGYYGRVYRRPDSFQHQPRKIYGVAVRDAFLHAALAHLLRERGPVRRADGYEHDDRGVRAGAARRGYYYQDRGLRDRRKAFRIQQQGIPCR